MASQTTALFAAAQAAIITSTLGGAAATAAAGALASDAPRRWIGTHSGSFHCDEALACAMLKLLPSYAEHGILRTRDPALLEQCEIVVDVGATYDAEARRFDHHQKGFAETLPGFETKLSSAGLVYKHYGREVLAAVLGPEAQPEMVGILYDKVYRNFVEHIDGIDNGVKSADGAERYKVTTTLSSRVGRLNPSWNQEASGDEVNESFRGAMQLCGTEFAEVVSDYATSWWPARELVLQAVEARQQVHASGRIVLFEQYCPWQAHLFDIEKQQGFTEEQQLLYAIYQDSAGSWRIQCVPDENEAFKSRHPMPEPWRGVRDAALSELSGIEGCVFVHAAGFIGGNATREGALAMAEASLPSSSS